jgi:aryl-alcohol dehydrogenase-like predicted oxidoreductase
MVTLGKSGLSASEIGLGLAAIGRPGYITLGRERDLGDDRSVESMRNKALDLLDAAYVGGVRYFDAARSYGRAEEFLAAWLERNLHSGRWCGDITVGSKWGYRYTADWQVGAEVNEVKDHSLAHLRRQLAETRSILGDSLCLYQIHSATLESGVLSDRGVIDELKRLKDSGLAVGLTVSGVQQSDVIRRAIEIRFGGEPLFATVQATWNLLERSAGPALAEARQAGLGIIVKESLANGRLVAGAARSSARVTVAAGAVDEANAEFGADEQEDAPVLDALDAAAAPILDAEPDEPDQDEEVDDQLPADWDGDPDDGDAPERPLPPALGPLAPLVNLARRRDRSPEAVAIAAALAQPWSDVVLSGAVTPAQISSNLSAAKVFITPDDLDSLAEMAEPPDRYWATRASLAWT